MNNAQVFHVLWKTMARQRILNLVENRDFGDLKADYIFLDRIDPSVSVKEYLEENMEDLCIIHSQHWGRM